jgi:hypothetical protein
MFFRNWNVKAILQHWLLVAIIVTGLIGLLYAAVQQDIRQGANDPQIQMAEDAAAKLAGGQSVQSVVPAEKVDIATSLAPYLIIFDANGNTIASSAQLDGQTPTIPSGIFDSVRRNGEDRITWQPQTGVRSAIVATQFTGSTSGFVVAGRSLREVEKREDGLLQILVAGWVVMMLVTFAATALLFRKSATPPTPPPAER